MGNSESQGTMIGVQGSTPKRNRSWPRRHISKQNRQSQEQDTIVGGSDESSQKGSYRRSTSNNEASGNEANKKAARRCEMALFAAASAADETKNDPPEFTKEERDLVIRSWADVDKHISQVRVGSNHVVVSASQ
jgi:hypothetical protein